MFSNWFAALSTSTPGLCTDWAARGPGRARISTGRAGPGQKSLDCIHDGWRPAINVSTVTQRSAVQAAAVTDALPRRPRDVWFQQSSNELLVCYHCPNCILDHCCQYQ